MSGGESRKAAGSSETPVVAPPTQDSRYVPNGGAAKAGDNPPPVPLRDKITELRELMEAASREPVEAVVKPLIYRDDYGRVISETQWKRLQERKKKAKEGGYEIDKYSQ